MVHRLPLQKGSTAMLPGWVVAVTEPRAEARAVANVRKLGYEVFYPKVVRRLRQHGQRSWVIYPLFPRYFFTWVERCWNDLLGTPGVVGLLMQGEQLATVRVDAMQELKERCTEYGIYLNPARLQRGQKVKVSTGVLVDQVGIFDEVSGQQEAALFNLLGTQRRVLFKKGVLVAVS
jgi:transcriptional antiterminator RfaH